MAARWTAIRNPAISNSLAYELVGMESDDDCEAGGEIGQDLSHYDDDIDDLLAGGADHRLETVVLPLNLAVRRVMQIGRHARQPAVITIACEASSTTEVSVDSCGEIPIGLYVEGPNGGGVFRRASWPQAAFPQHGTRDSGRGMLCIRKRRSAPPIAYTTASGAWRVWSDARRMYVHAPAITSRFAAEQALPKLMVKLTLPMCGDPNFRLAVKTYQLNKVTSSAKRTIEGLQNRTRDNRAFLCFLQYFIFIFLELQNATTKLHPILL